MMEIDLNFCRICLKSSSSLKLINSSIINRFLRDFLEAKDRISDIWLCAWCDSSIKRANHLIKIAEKSKTILENYKKGSSIISQNNSGCTGIFTLNYVHNKHIDIPPVTNKHDETFHEENITVFNRDSVPEEHQKDNVEEIKNELDGFNDEDITILSFEGDEFEVKHGEEENSEVKYDEEKFKSKERSKNKKQIDYEEMKFEVKCLNHEEQLNEVEMKKQTEKYKNMKYKCEKCGIGYMFEDIFNEHMKRHNQITPHKCPVCSLYFKSKDVFSQHTLAHRRGFVCLVCGAKFTRWRHCILHRYKCDDRYHYVGLPNTKLLTNVSRNIIKGVQKEKKYACDDCDRRFATKHRLTVHIRTHSSLRVYRCTTCARSFTTQYNLRVHTHTHTQVSSYYCVECDKRYKSQKGLDRHYRESKRHLGEEELSFTCPECPKRFTKESQLNSHIKTRHLTTYRCDVCDKTFSSNTNLRKHVRCVHAKEKAE